MAQKNNVVELTNRRKETREQVLERLFSEHSYALRGFLCLRLGVFEEQDDIVQEVFSRLARMDNLASKLPCGESRNRSFIFRVANNYVRDLERRKAVRTRYVEEFRAQMPEDAEMSSVSPERQVQAEQQLGYLKNAVMTLKPKCREVFIRNRFMDKSYREVAADMGLSVKQVEKYMQQALMRVRRVAAEFKGAEE